MLICTVLLTNTTAISQRFTDKLDRGLVAIPANTNWGSGSGNFVSWRVLAEEYYDVTYNLYANGSLVKSGLTVSNFTHTSGNSSTRYQVAAVVRGVEQEKCAEVKCWASGYKDIPGQPVIDRNGVDVTFSQNYVFNDVSLGDVDGDGVVEFIAKRNNGKDLRLTSNKTAYNFYECYKLTGERLWTIDLGPNLMAGPDEQWDLVLYDWDEDGKCELLMRGADNMIIHTADGKTINVGDMSLDTRWDGIENTTTGAEYLLYMEGATARPYGWDGSSDTFQPMAYPLPRYDAGEPEDEAAIWGAGILGHRATKHFFGAPFLDGRHASIFLGRGIYTREKMVALDVNPQTHELTERWRWHCYDGGPWFGQGYHNYAIADVDWDGRDEIVYGSMVIDDNGHGLSTTGLGHGDAQHCGDLDPYRHGQEQFACNETSPCMNYRNATTSEMYYRWVGGGDDGRCLAGNFSNTYPGSMGRSVGTGMISCVADKPIQNVNTDIAWSDLNNRIYWDGDLLDEVLNSPGVARQAKIDKPGVGRIWLSDGGNMNNSSKNNPGAQGDILGDWREEVVLTCGNGLRVFTTPHPTAFRIPTLWHDHQYRQAMVWQPLGYNQPPHVSYFIGELEGITIAPPPLTTTDRVTVPDGGTIGPALNDQHVMLCETADAAISVSEGASPWVFTDNTPSWVQGTDVNGTSTLENPAEIIRTYYTHTVTGAAFTGVMRLVKQGDGTLVLPKVAQTYTGSTDIWAGTLKFDGTLLQSDLWLNRFARLVTNGGQFKSIKADYASTIEGPFQVKEELKLGFGSRVVFTVGGNDQIAMQTLTIEKKNWKYGPKYLTPIFEFRSTDGAGIAPGRYLLGTVQNVTGSLDDILIEGVPTSLKTVLEKDGENLYLVVSPLRDASTIVWTGANSGVWDFAKTENFSNGGQSDIFVEGDNVLFDDNAASTTVTLDGDLIADSVIVDATRSYVFKGNGKLTGGSTLVKRGTGKLTIQTDNTFTGGVHLSGGVTVVSTLANTTQSYGGLGDMTTKAEEFIIENGAELFTTGAVRIDSPIQLCSDEGGVINKSSTFFTSKAITGKRLTLKGTGIFQFGEACPQLDTLVVQAGAVDLVGHNRPAKAVILEGGSLRDGAPAYSVASVPLIVPKGKSSIYYLAERCGYTNKITGDGTLAVECPATNGTVARTAFAANLAGFKGTLKAVGAGGWGFFVFDNNSNMSKGTLQIADNVTVVNSGKTMTFGCVKGDNGKLGGFEAAGARISEASNNWRIGNDENWSWGGAVTGNAILTKIGTGKVTLNGTSDHTGATNVEAGELHFGNKATLGKGALNVKRNAILSGVTTATGNLTNASYKFQAGSTLQVGSSAMSNTGVINFGNKNVTFVAGSFLQIGVNRSATDTNTGCTSIAAINRLTMNATIQLHYADTFAPEVGDSIVLWKDVVSFTGTPELEDTVIDAERGLYWDTIDLSKGILRVTNHVPASINDMRHKREDHSAVYDLNGRRVADDPAHIRKGIYIRNGKKIVVR